MVKQSIMVISKQIISTRLVLLMVCALTITGCKQQQPESLIDRFARLQERGTMFGHQDDTFYGLGWQWEHGRSDVLETCGDYPAVMGFDLGGIEMGDAKNLDSVPFVRIREEILAQVKRGGIVAVSWHPRNPLTTIEGGGNGGQPFPKGTAWDISDSTVVRQVLPDGPLYEKFQLWMQRLSAFLQSLKDEDGHPVPLIFRPWHENNGSWFWWGRGLCTAEEYKALWRMLQDYLRHDGLENLVWSWSPNLGLKTDDFYTYPGDDRVDIIGLDAYQGGTEQDFVRQLNEDLAVLTEKAVSSKKLVALTECGYENIPDSTWWTRVLLPIVQRHKLSYFLVWRNARPSHHFAPAPGTPDAEDFCKMVKEKRVLMLKDLKK